MSTHPDSPNAAETAAEIIIQVLLRQLNAEREQTGAEKT